MDNDITLLVAKLQGEVSFARWEEIGERLLARSAHMQWALADWWAFGERYDSRRYTLPDHFGMNYRTLDNMASTARTFAVSRRREKLSFAHHTEVAALPPDEQDALLDWCLEGMEVNSRPRRRDRLRQEIRRRDAAANKLRAAHLVIEPVDLPTRNIRLVFEAETPREMLSTSQPGPLVELDSSPGGTPTPPELRDLTLEPPVPFNKIEVAKRALEALTTDELSEVVTACLDERKHREKLEIMVGLFAGCSAKDRTVIWALAEVPE